MPTQNTNNLIPISNYESNPQIYWAFSALDKTGFDKTPDGNIDLDNITFNTDGVGPMGDMDDLATLNNTIQKMGLVTWPPIQMDAFIEAQKEVWRLKSVKVDEFQKDLEGEGSTNGREATYPENMFFFVPKPTQNYCRSEFMKNDGWSDENFKDCILAELGQKSTWGKFNATLGFGYQSLNRKYKYDPKVRKLAEEWYAAYQTAINYDYHSVLPNVGPIPPMSKKDIENSYSWSVFHIALTTDPGYTVIGSKLFLQLTPLEIDIGDDKNVTRFKAVDGQVSFPFHAKNLWHAGFSAATYDPVFDILDLASLRAGMGYFIQGEMSSENRDNNWELKNGADLLALLRDYTLLNITFGGLSLLSKTRDFSRNDILNAYIGKDGEDMDNAYYGSKINLFESDASHGTHNYRFGDYVVHNGEGYSTLHSYQSGLASFHVKAEITGEQKLSNAFSLAYQVDSRYHPAMSKAVVEGKASFNLNLGIPAHLYLEGGGVKVFDRGYDDYPLVVDEVWGYDVMIGVRGFPSAFF